VSKKNTRQITSYVEFLFPTIDKELLCECFFYTRQIAFLSNAFFDTRQRSVRMFLTIGKDKFQIVF
jgi:hypothetical protein